MAISPVSPLQVGSQAVTKTQTDRDLRLRPQQAASTSVAQQTGKTFEQMLSALNDSQLTTDAYVEKLAMGESVDLHDVMLNLEQNDVQFRVALAIRDHLVEAYREMMRMQV